MTSGHYRPARPGAGYLPILCVLAFALASPAWSEVGTTLFARESALGGPHAALADDLSTLFSNPAGFRSAGPELSLAELTVGLSGPVFDLANIFVEASGSGIEAIMTSAAVQKLLQSMQAHFGLAGPVAFGYVGNGLGFGFFNESDLSINSSGVLPTISALASETFTLSGGYAFRLPLGGERSTLDIGLLMKAFVRGGVQIEKDLLGLVSVLQSPSTAVLLDSPFDLDVGVGIDAGVLYGLDKRFFAGLVVRDAYAPYLRNSYDTMQAVMDGLAPAGHTYMLTPLDLSVGVGFRPALGKLERVVSDLVLLLDYVDILDFVVDPANARNPVLHVELGAEVELLDVLSLRAGFSQGLLAAGLGIDLRICTLNLSMFGQEMSSEPGLAPTYNVVLGLEFRL
jgi:hypothetical protein